jgi:2-keto-4-pentenoate hydratase
MTSDSAPAVSAAAQRLRAAAQDRRPCPPVRDLLGCADIGAAYAVQLHNRDHDVRAGRRPLGRKIGLTSAKAQKQLGVEQPDFGLLFEDMVYPSGAGLPVARLLQPKVEAEIAFVLARDIDRPVGARSVAAAVAHALPALEIPDSRIIGWDITIVDTVADNASSGLVVLGDTPVPLAGLQLPEISMTLDCNGSRVSAGTGWECMGDPLAALAWLSNTLLARGLPLVAGEVVLSGALGPMADVGFGDCVRARFTGFADVTASFE